jgi:hypothetical protein
MFYIEPYLKLQLLYALQNSLYGLAFSQLDSHF